MIPYINYISLYLYVYLLLITLNLDIPIWECNVFNTIIPDQCKLVVGAVRLELKLRKRNIGIMWTTLHDVKVC